MPGLFDEFRLKDVTLRNRIAVSPMCQYSATDGMPNDWHLVHLGARAVGGAGLVSVEATGVTPAGRISPGCTGLWSDAHADAFGRIARFVKEHGAVPAIQIAHAGRKASAQRPWDGDAHLTPAQGGWEILGPSAEAFGGNLPIVPKAMTKADIAATSAAFAAAAGRALAAGFEWLELHFAHGYLAHSFFSPLSNHRTDEYGGSLVNRARFLTETLAAVRKVWPERLPLTARLSVEDYAPGGLTLDDSVELAELLKAGGLDMIDVSMGFNVPDVSGIPWAPGFLAPASARLRRETGLPTSVGWLILEAKQADDIVRAEQADVVMLAREMLRDPHWPYHAAVKLGRDKPHAVLPVQYARVARR
jgi:2,4-dienoyl-CoA reductase-like NADH-dependent reductase (Old Yellow Enzyme family)